MSDDTKKISKLLKTISALKGKIAALEADKPGCEYCSETVYIYTGGTGFDGKRTGEYEEVEHKYCYNCGRKLI